MIDLTVTGTLTCLTFGPLQVIMQSDDAALHQHFRSAYGAFTAPTVATSHNLTLRLERQSGTAPLDSLIPAEFQDGVLRFNSPAYSGHIDQRAGQAVCVLTTAQPLIAADYFLRSAVALLAFEAGGLLLHAASVVRRGRAYLFFGPSGAGKTTASRVSRDQAGATVLNDDLVILLPQADRWLVQATPFTNPTQMPPAGDLRSPLRAIYRLIQSPQVYTEPIVPGLAVAELLTSCAIVNGDPSRADRLLARLENIVRTIPVRRLYLRPEASFWANLDPT